MEQKKLAKGVITTVRSLLDFSTYFRPFSRPLKDQLTQSDYSDPISQVQTGRTMQLMVPLEPNQRARYEKELLRDLRFISVENEGTMTLQVDNCNSFILLQTSLVLSRSRIFAVSYNRFLIWELHAQPYLTESIAFFLSIPIHCGSKIYKQVSIMVHSSFASVIKWWKMDKSSIFYHFILIESRKYLFSLDKLLMERLKQGVLSAMQQWRIHTSSRLDFTGKKMYLWYEYLNKWIDRMVSNQYTKSERYDLGVPITGIDSLFSNFSNGCKSECICNGSDLSYRADSWICRQWNYKFTIEWSIHETTWNETPTKILEQGIEMTKNRCNWWHVIYFQLPTSKARRTSKE